MLAASAALPASVTTAPIEGGRSVRVPEQCCGQEFRRGGVEIESAGLERRYGFAGWRQGCPWARAQSACMCDSFESVVLHSLHPPGSEGCPSGVAGSCAQGFFQASAPGCGCVALGFTRARTTTGVLWRDTAFSKGDSSKGGQFQQQPKLGQAPQRTSAASPVENRCR